MMMSAAFTPGVAGGGKGKALRTMGPGGGGMGGMGGFAAGGPVLEANGPSTGKWAGVQSLGEAIHEALEPFVSTDPHWSPEEVEKRVGAYINKAAQKYKKHEMAGQRGTAAQAQALIEEFVDCAMNAVSAACYDKQWFQEANFAGPLLAAAASTFQGCKLFARTLVPVLKSYVEEALFSFREEERIQKAMWDVVTTSELAETYHKRVNGHLQKAYDEAHLGAKYMTSIAMSPEMGLLQDFVQGWMKEFVGRSWDLLQNAIAASKDDQIGFVVALFQKLADPEICCLPYGLVAPLEGNMPPAGWSFIMETAYTVCAEADAAPVKKQKTVEEGAAGAESWEGWGKKKKKTAAWGGAGGGMTAAGAMPAANGESSGHPSCTNAGACIGGTDCPLVRHLIDESTRGDVYCQMCWDAVVGARPELLCEFV